MLKRTLQIAGFLLLVLVIAVALNTWRQPSRQLQVAPAAPLPVDAQAAAQRLAGAVRFRTISSADDADANAEAFTQLHDYLQQQFPRLHAGLKRERVGRHALLYTWNGRDAQARPVALMAHQDVVPIAPGTHDQWQHDPFAGAIADGFIWGRGTWDDKGNLMSQLEAIEMLLGAGFQPRQTIYLIFGDDEEVGGRRGAAAVAELLESRQVRLAWTLDEGLLVTEGVLPGLDKPAALVGLAEKGYGTFNLSIEAVPGHSSMPPRHGAIGGLSAALARLEAQPMPATIDGVAAEMFDTLAPEMSGFNRVALSNRWLFGPMVQRQLERSPSSNAMLRTTTALTVVRAGERDNVLPGRADASVNFRILPGDTLASVEKHVHRTIDNDAIRVVAAPGNSEPSAISPTEGPGYDAIARTVREVFPAAAVAPGLMIGATDSRHLAGISDAVYRFSPVRARGEDLPRFHGTNERVSIDNYVEMIRFYHQLLRNAAQPLSAAPAPNQRNSP